MFGFPLLLIPLAICNIIVFLMPGTSFSAPLVTLPLMPGLLSGANWTITLADAVLALGILMLMFEVIKGARPHGKYLTDHLLAFLVFAGATAEFLLLPQFASSMFFLLALMALVDFLAGIAQRARRPRYVAAPAPVVQAPVQTPVAAPVPVAEPVAPPPVQTVTPATPVVPAAPVVTPAPAPVVTSAPTASETAIPLPAPAPTAAELQGRVEPIVAVPVQPTNAEDKAADGKPAGGKPASTPVETPKPISS